MRCSSSIGGLFQQDAALNNDQNKPGRSPAIEYFIEQQGPPGDGVHRRPASHKAPQTLINALSPMRVIECLQTLVPASGLIGIMSSGRMPGLRYIDREGKTVP